MDDTRVIWERPGRGPSPEFVQRNAEVRARLLIGELLHLVPGQLISSLFKGPG
jgi:hypothetical protein